jgi:hypothetical protein
MTSRTISLLRYLYRQFCENFESIQIKVLIFIFQSFTNNNDNKKIYANRQRNLIPIL